MAVHRRVGVAMSGGVDSSMAAALLKDDGYEVTGFHLQLHSNDDSAGLKQICEILDIPLQIVDLQKDFRNNVINYFLDEYSSGHTPNPCVVCNRKVKFGLLLEKALETGMDYMATGHYAGIARPGDLYQLIKAKDGTKDQTYFLYCLGQKQLQHVLFPLSQFTKTQVKTMAGERNLPLEKIEESQDICFLTNNSVESFLKDNINLIPGDIVDINGKILGRHNGLALYTIGKRKNLRISSSERLFVIKLDTANNRLVVGSREQLYCDRLLADNLSWIAGSPPKEFEQITARTRYRSAAIPVILKLQDDKAYVEFSKSQWAVAPGQSIVFYRGDIVLGGGVIEEAVPVL